MSRPPSSNSVNLNGVFQRVQEQMRAHLACSDVFEQPAACGAFSERGWIELFSHYLPQRYSAAPAFVVDADGRRSRQIDIAVYDNFYSPLIFPDEAGVHVPAESVYAVFEVKTVLTRQHLRDACHKAASVRALRRTSAEVISAGARRPPIVPQHILAGVLSLDTVWPKRFEQQLPKIVLDMPREQRLDIGCALRQGAFELFGRARRRPKFHFSTREEALIYFVFRFLDRLRALGTAPAMDLMDYGRCLASIKTLSKDEYRPTDHGITPCRRR